MPRPKASAVVLFLVLNVFMLLCPRPAMSQGNLRTNKRSEMLSSVLNKVSSNKVPPMFDADMPTLVYCQVYVDSFDSISEASMDFTVSMMLSLSWRQKDLSYQYAVDFFEIDNANMQKLWIPDLFFPNEKKTSFHSVMNHNKMMRIYPDGRLTYYARLSLTLSCPMNLRNYPFDRQECALKLESFGFDANKLQLEWVTDDVPVDVNKDIQLPQFQVVSHESKRCEDGRDYSRMGNHSCLEATFRLERSLQYYLIQMYIPSTLVVIVSWLSFWLTVGSVAGRISLGVLTVLTMTTQSSSVNASLPRVSYIKAIDLWMSTCLVFVFAALIEFAVVNVLSRRKDTSRKASPARRQENGAGVGAGISSHSGAMYDASQQEVDPEKGSVKETIVDVDGQIQLVEADQDSEQSKQHGCCTSMTLAIMLDRASRAVFPFLFACFCTSYWTYYAFFVETSLSIQDANETDISLFA